MLTYLFETTLCWAGFYLLYHLLLSKETFFRLNRWYLLVTVMLGLVIPLLSLSLEVSGEASPVFYLQPVTIGMEQLETAIVTAYNQGEGFDFVALLTWIYFGGAAVALARMLYGLSQIFSLYKTGEASPGNGYRFIATGQPHVPFSFFNHLFWSQSFEVSEEERRSIIRHEEAHIFQRHSFDVMLMESLGVVFWCSPFIYLYKKAVKTTHEYLADAYVLESAGKKQYGRLLLRQSQSGMQIAISNSLFHSQLKKRIVMMTKNKSSRRASLKYLAALPLLMAFLLAFSFREKLAAVNPDAENPAYHTGAALDIYPEFLSGELSEATDTVPAGSEVFKMVEEPPLFPGCEAEADKVERKKCADGNMLQFIYQNVKYPADARKSHIEGMVVIKFVIGKDGSIGNAKILRDIGGGCGEEALRVVKMMPRWQPGKKDGEPVNVEFNLPIKFKLQEEDKAAVAPVREPDEMPRFAGCEEAEDKAVCSQEKYLQFFNDHLKFPESVKKTGVNGTVMAKFVIDKTGALRKAEIVKSVGPDIDAEVLRVLAAMPRWEPGKKDGKPVDVELVLPFKFSFWVGEPVQENAGTLPKAEIFEAYPNPASGNSFSVRFKTAPGSLSIIFRDAAGRDLLEKTVKDYDGSERIEKIGTKGLFGNNTSKGTVFVSLVDAKGNILGNTTVVVQ